MCMFVGQAKVGGTKIFAKKEGRRQFLVYEARVESRTSNAMILPVPVASQNSSVELIDLSAFENLFEELFSVYLPSLAPMRGFGGPGAGTLEVVTVGSYEASIVPSLADMERLDARFQLSPSMKRAFASRYADHAFVVYQFAPGKQKLHPFGFSFESRYDGSIFFPTLHVHDGRSVPDVAWFDHHFFAQRSKLGERYTAHPTTSHTTWDGRLRFPPFIDMMTPLEHDSRLGRHPNQDLLVALDG